MRAFAARLGGAARIAVILSALVLLPLPLEPQPAPAGSVEGIVRNQATGRPVRRAQVQVSSVDPQGGYAVAITGADGSFRLPGIPPGSYRLQAAKDGFIPLPFGADSFESPPVLFSLAAGEERRNADLLIVPFASIEGEVRGDLGEPAVNATVKLVRVHYPRGKRALAPAGQGLTDDRGHYRIFRIPPGVYYLLLQPGTAGMSIGSSDGNHIFQLVGAAFGSLFYPNATSLSAASPIRVSAGKELLRHDFRLPPPQPESRIRIRIPPIPDSPPDLAGEVSLIAVEGAPSADGINFSFPFGKAGQPVEVKGIPPGAYRITARAHWQGRPYTGAAAINVSSGEDPEVALSLEAPIELSGSVTVEGPGGESLRSFRVSLTSGEIYPFDTVPPPVTTPPGVSFTFPNVPSGIWDIGVAPIPPGGYLKSMRLGDQDVLTEEMVIGPRSAGPLKIIVSTQAARLAGDVLDPAGKPVGPAIVLLAPDGKFRNVLSFYHFTPVDQTGRFTMKGLNPGDYRLYAFEKVAHQAWFDPDFLSPFRERSQSIRLVEGVEATAQVRRIAAAPERPQ